MARVLAHEMGILLITHGVRLHLAAARNIKIAIRECPADTGKIKISGQNGGCVGKVWLAPQQGLFDLSSSSLAVKGTSDGGRQESVPKGLLNTPSPPWECASHTHCCDHKQGRWSSASHLCAQRHAPTSVYATCHMTTSEPILLLGPFVDEKNLVQRGEVTCQARAPGTQAQVSLSAEPTPVGELQVERGG